MSSDAGPPAVSADAAGIARGLAIEPDIHLADDVLRHALLDGERPAIIRGGKTITFRALGERIRRCADGLRREGVAPGTRLALSAARIDSAIVGLLGATLSGAVVAPLSPETPGEERERLTASLSLAGTLVDGRAEILSIGRLVDRGDPSANPRAPGGNAPATIMLTSGTTDVPKAIELSHFRQVWVLRTMAAALGIDRSDRHMPLVAPHFSLARNAMLRVLYAGGTVVESGATTVDELAALADQHAITDLSMTPSHVRYLLARAPADRLALPGLRRMLVSSAFLHHAERQQIMRTLTPRLHIYLGMNEVGFATLARPDDLRTVPDTVGRALPGVRVEVVDDDARALPPGEAGALRIAGPNVPPGYLADEAATQRHFREGWFHPGDIARIDRDGFLFLLGRADDRINHGGVKVYPIEIERALRAHPAVADVAVVGLPAQQSGEVPAAAVVLNRPTPKKVLRAHCVAQLGRFKAPTVIVVVDALPRNAMNKVPPEALRTMILAHRSKKR